MMPSPTPRLRLSSLALAILTALALTGCVSDGTTTGSIPSGHASAYADNTPVPYAGNPNAADREASAECWMKYEHGRRDLPLDTRADLVDKCIAAKEAKATR